MVGRTKEKPVFEIGLVMAGAVSAGAYTAGVMDYLIQALDAWYSNPAFENGPPHDVRIKVMSGASAGGMSAALTTTLVNRSIDHVPADPETAPDSNKLYNCWVKQICMEDLLGTNDLANPMSYVRSLLNASRLDEIADKAFEDTGEPKERLYFDPELDVLLTVTNLRGVPYKVDFSDSAGDSGGGEGHELSLHADYMHFVVSKTAVGTDGVIHLDPDNRNTAQWQTLRNTALATGASPFGLAARPLVRKASDYDGRYDTGPTAYPWKKRGFARASLERGQIRPHWPAGFRPQSSTEPVPDYEFLCTDGGVMNNEPMELAWRILSQGKTDTKQQEPKKVDHAMVLIDPFPNTAPFDSNYEPKDSLLSFAKQLSAALLAQVRFRLEELVLARDRGAYSQFMIAPSRGNHQPNQPLLAGGSLSAFGGFLNECFREHDFRLGRRNCQKFLRDRFVLPSNNVLFNNWPTELRDPYIPEGGDSSHLPIIPLVGSLRTTTEQRHKWPKMTEEDLRNLSKQVRRRTCWLLRRLLNKEAADDAVEKAEPDKTWRQRVVGWLIRILWACTWWLLICPVTKVVMRIIRTNLSDCDLLENTTSSAEPCEQAQAQQRM